MSYDYKLPFKSLSKPATPAAVLLKETYEDKFKAKCKHKDLAEAFLRWLGTGVYRDYIFKGNERYGILTDNGNWVEFERYDGTLQPKERVTKAFLKLKSGYNFTKWGAFLDTFRPLFKAVSEPAGDPSKGFFTTIVQLHSGERFTLTSRVAVANSSYNPASVPGEDFESSFGDYEKMSVE